MQIFSSDVVKDSFGIAQTGKSFRNDYGRTFYLPFLRIRTDGDGVLREPAPKMSG